MAIQLDAPYEKNGNSQSLSERVKLEVLGHGWRGI
jgi:hypothetical protein